MSISKALQQKQHAEIRVFIRLHLSEAVARGASHIRSKRPASLQEGIDEVRREYAADFGEDTVAAFLECIELWLSDRSNTVAAAALRLYLQTALPHADFPRRLDEAEEGPDGAVDCDALDASHDFSAGTIALPLAGSVVSIYAIDHFAASTDAAATRRVSRSPSARPRHEADGAPGRPLPGAVVASRAALRSRPAGNSPAAHSYRSSRLR